MGKVLWVSVNCPQCDGRGTVPEPSWYMHTDGYHYVPCDTCNGYGKMLAQPIGAIKKVRERKGLLRDGSGNIIGEFFINKRRK